jgi:hypothetical protein
VQPPQQPVQPQQPVNPVQPPPVTFSEPPPPPQQQSTVPVQQPIQPAVQQQPPVQNITPQLVNFDEPKPLPANPPACINCGTQISKPLPPPVEENCQDRSKCQPPHGALKGKCTSPVNVTKDRNKLDILFVVDTSKSLRTGGNRTAADGELVQIGRGMKEFVKNLDPETDYNIAIMTGHGPASPYHGKLLAENGSVISYNAVKRGRSREQAEQEIARILEMKMRATPNESRGAQGEAMLLSLYDAVTQPHLRKAIESQNFFRKDAALNVIIVSDEQDVCYDYGSEDKRTANKIVPGKKDPVVDEEERKFFQDVCLHAVGGTYRNGKMTGGTKLTPGHVWDALRSLKADSVTKRADETKLILNAIVYTTDVPDSLKGEANDENEKGHGLIEFVQLGGGKFAPLENVYLNRSQFGPELDLLGKMAKFRMKYSDRFECAARTEDGRDIHPDAMNSTTMIATVYDDYGQRIATFSGSCGPNGCDKNKFNGDLKMDRRTDTNGKLTPYATLRADMNTLRPILEYYQVQNGKVEIEFMTVSDRNPQTGKLWDRKELKPIQKPQQQNAVLPKPVVPPAEPAAKQAGASGDIKRPASRRN